MEKDCERLIKVIEGGKNYFGLSELVEYRIETEEDVRWTLGKLKQGWYDGKFGTLFMENFLSVIPISRSFWEELKNSQFFRSLQIDIEKVGENLRNEATKEKLVARLEGSGFNTSLEESWFEAYLPKINILYSLGRGSTYLEIYSSLKECRKISCSFKKVRVMFKDCIYINSSTRYDILSSKAIGVQWVIGMREDPKVVEDLKLWRNNLL